MRFRILIVMVILVWSNYTYGFSPNKVVIPPENIQEIPAGGEDYPCWSPDGEKIASIAYAQWENFDGVLLIYNLTTGSKTSLTLPNLWYKEPKDGDARAPDFSPDGKQVVFILTKENNYIPQVWKMNVDGSNKKQLTNFKEESNFCPRWSPDGKKILVYLTWDHFYLIDVETSEEIKIPCKIGGIGDWSPDGQKIAIVSKENLWIINSDGTNPVQLTTDGKASRDYTPSWSPDSSKIAYTKVGKYYRGCNSSIIIINADGSNPIELVLPNKLGGNCPSWSPDGTKIIFVGKKDITEPYGKQHREEAGIYILTLPPELQCAPKKGMRKKEVGKSRTGEVFEAKRPKSTMMIDGRLNEWTDAKEVAIDKKEYVTYEASNWQGKEDLSAMAMIQGDDKNLYLGVKVKDDKFVQQFSGDKMLNGDHLELWVATPKGIYQFGISPGDFEKLVPEVLLWLPGLSDKKKQEILKGIEVGSKKSNEGYFIEAKIPLANLGIAPKKNNSIGFTVVISDTDNEAKPKQDCLLASSQLEWNKPETFGKLVFK